MKLKLDGIEIGSIYLNVQFNREDLDMLPEQLLEKIKTENLLWDGKEVSIESYRKVYLDDKYVYLEGAQLILK